MLFDKLPDRETATDTKEEIFPYSMQQFITEGKLVGQVVLDHRQRPWINEVIKRRPRLSALFASSVSVSYIHRFNRFYRSRKTLITSSEMSF